MERLSEREKQTVTRRRLRRLTPPGRPEREPAERPHAVLIGGQQASGKTTTQGFVHQSLGVRNAASYDGCCGAGR
ncbi:zeta toxin family protein [Lipingzhangella halophila]|uniref:zeta toxin family protein n=1 Tax=Lipingzhangella halophila TaxID=1783352 RepID=UPI0035E45895